MKSFEIRPIRNRNELEECYDLWGNVFAESASRSFFQRRLDYDENYLFETTWVAKTDGEIASAVQIFPYYTRQEDIHLRVGGIGNVATNPAYRGKGLAKEILRAQNLWMENNGFDLSLLFTGIHSFYMQTGWCLISEEMFVFDRDCVNVSKSALSRAESEMGTATLPVDIEGMIRVYDACNQKQSNSMIRTKHYWLNQMKWKNETPSNFFVKKENGLITAYIRFSHKKELETEILEACYLDGKEDDMVCLFLHLMQHSDCKKKVSIRIPKNHILMDVLAETGIKPTPFHGAMWRFYNFTKLLKKIESALQERASKQLEMFTGKALLLRCGEDGVTLDFDRSGELCVHPYDGQPKFDAYIDLTDIQFLGLLTQGIRFLDNHKLSENTYLKLLFPNQNGILWTSDFF